jgi:glutathione S-transferase
MQLYELGPTRSIRVRWTLQELGVPFESVLVNIPKGEHHRPEFLKLNPAGKLPVLVDGDRVLTESVAIVLYLAEKYPAKELLPADLAERGQAYRWLLFAATELEQPLWRITRNTSLYAEEERQPSDVAIAQREFREAAAIASDHLNGRAFVAGDRFGVADVVMAYTLDWGHEVKLLQKFPVLEAYIERMYERPQAAPRIAAAFAAMPR